MNEARGESSGRLYESLKLDEKQTVYDIAAWEYVEYLRGMTAQQAAAHFKRVEWIEQLTGEELDG